MHTLITRPNPARRSSRRAAPAPAALAGFRSPHYDCQAQAGLLRLVVYVPGVDSAGIEISAEEPDLTVTARKTRFVRANWTALNLERTQRDYQLRLRLGHAYDYEAVRAELHDGVLTLTLPERTAVAPATRGRERELWPRVA
jgi:HSP20 family molecular chaperone IbpA